MQTHIVNGIMITDYPPKCTQTICNPALECCIVGSLHMLTAFVHLFNRCYFLWQSVQGCLENQYVSISLNLLLGCRGVNAEPRCFTMGIILSVYLHFIHLQFLSDRFSCCWKCYIDSQEIISVFNPENKSHLGSDYKCPLGVPEICLIPVLEGTHLWEGNNFDQLSLFGKH